MLNTNLNKPDIKVQMLYNSTYLKYLEQANSQKKKVDKRLPWAQGSYCLMGRVFVWGNEKFWKQKVVLVAQRGKYNQCHRIVQNKMAN